MDRRKKNDYERGSEALAVLHSLLSYGDNLHYEKFSNGSVKCIEDEIPFDLPDGWTWTRIKTVSIDLPYGTSKKSNSSGKVAVLRMGNLQDGEIDYSDLVYSSDEADIEKYYLLENDLLFNRTNSAEWVGKTSIYRGDIPAIYAGYLIRIRTLLCGEYLNAVMNSSYAKNYCIRVKTDAVNQSNINAQKLGMFLVPVAPIKEQHRIVTSFKRTFEFTQCIQSEKKELSALIQSTKTKILDLAIRGQLVPQNPDDEPASVLLERIRAEKEELIKQGKIKRDKKESVIFRGEDNSYYEKIDMKVRCINIEIPFDLPETWCWCRLGTLFDHNTGKALNSADSAGTPMTYITTSNLYWDRFELDSLKEMLFADSEIDKCTVKKGDLLVCEGGDIGRSAIWMFEENIRIQNHIHRLRPYISLSGRFYYYVMYMWKQLGLIGGQGIGLQGFSSKMLHNLIVPLPSIDEQERIVAFIDKLFEQIESIEKSLS